MSTVKNVIYENGQFLKVVEKMEYSPLFTTQVITSVTEDGVPTFVDATEFPSGRKVEEKQAATFFQWLAWKLFKVYR